MKGDPNQGSDEFTMAVEFDLVLCFRIVDCDVAIFLSIGQSLAIRRLLNCHDPVISFNFLERSLSEEIP